MKRIVYISIARPDLETSDFEAILATATAFNSSNNIDGLLLYNGLNFLQVLEGEIKSVDALYANIVEDARHHGVVTILNEEIETPAFSGWSMRMKRLPSDATGLNQDKTVMSDLTKELPENIPAALRSILTSFNTLKG